jgi:hypothetical protein
MQSSTIRPTLLLLLILENYNCTVYIVYKVFSLTTGRYLFWRAPENRKNVGIQTQYESFTELTHPLLYRIALLSFRWSLPLSGFLNYAYKTLIRILNPFFTTHVAALVTRLATPLE